MRRGVGEGRGGWEKDEGLEKGGRWCEKGMPLSTTSPKTTGKQK